ncbi:hypothetical protein MMC25_001542 [Agyrium rufum]|nr:hypothetical protein [Agyrium rufum]
MWYQGYYDLWLRGRYMWKLEELHEEYGPIVRINPYELHVNDPDWIDILFTGGSKKREKYRWIGRQLTLPNALTATISHNHHRKRRAVLNPYFSKASVRKLEPMVQDTLGELLKRMDAMADKGAIPLQYAYKATTTDIITEYCFGSTVNSNYLRMDDFNAPFFDAVQQNFEMSHWMMHLAWLGPLMAKLPERVMLTLMPPMVSLYRMQRQWVRQIDSIRGSKDEDFGKDTIFHGLLHNNLPESEKGSQRLQEEAQQLVLAGQDTTSSSLAAITFYLLETPEVLAKLKAELEIAMPDPNEIPTSAKVEPLPYLSAVIQEGLRIHPGGTLRTQRVAPDEALVYDDGETKWVIPPGTAISMDAPSIHGNTRIFPEPHRFRPERWIENPKLSRYQFAFSRGTRGCLGINLAYQELYLVLAGVFRKYDLYDESKKEQGPTLALFDTTLERDIGPVADMIVPLPEIGSKGLQVLVRSGRSA